MPSSSHLRGLEITWIPLSRLITLHHLHAHQMLLAQGIWFVLPLSSCFHYSRFKHDKESSQRAQFPSVSTDNHELWSWVQWIKLRHGVRAFGAVIWEQEDEQSHVCSLSGLRVPAVSVRLQEVVWGCCALAELATHSGCGHTRTGHSRVSRLWGCASQTRPWLINALTTVP